LDVCRVRNLKYAHPPANLVDGHVILTELVRITPAVVPRGWGRRSLVGRSSLFVVVSLEGREMKEASENL
jgi:hypothetical protein